VEGGHLGRLAESFEMTARQHRRVRTRRKRRRRGFVCPGSIKTLNGPNSHQDQKRKKQGNQRFRHIPKGFRGGGALKKSQIEAPKSVVKWSCFTSVTVTPVWQGGGGHRLWVKRHNQRWNNGIKTEPPWVALPLGEQRNLV